MRCLIICLMALLLGGCFWTSRHGDAKVKLIAEPFVLHSKNRTMTLPEFSISECGEHTFRITKLPVAMYPIDLAVLGVEYYHDSVKGVSPPWAGAQIEVAFQDVDGAVFFQRTIPLEGRPGVAWNNGKPFADYNIFESAFFHNNFDDPNLKPLPPAPRESYQVVVRVLKTSPRPGDVAYLRGTRSD